MIIKKIQMVINSKENNVLHHVCFTYNQLDQNCNVALVVHSKM